MTNGSAPAPTPGTTGCVGSCTVTYGTNVEVGSSWGGFATYTGAQCSASGPSTGTTKTLPDGTEGACIGSTCISKTKSQCGYVNNEYRCITSTQLNDTNPCVSTASGAKFCTGDAATPPAPNNGTPGTKANPDGVFTLKGPNGSGGTSYQTVNYYNSSTVNGDSEDPGGEGDPEDEGEEEEGEDCGAAGEPCNVKVDETGTGDGNLDLEPQNLDDFRSGVNAAAGTNPFGGLVDQASTAIQLPTASACQQFTVTFEIPIVGAVSGSFPSDLGCLWIERFKSVVAWFLYLATAVAIVRMALREAPASM